MRHLLPPNLGELARAADPDSVHYAIRGVKVECNDEKYRALATDSRMLVCIEGEYVNEESALTVSQPLPNGCQSAVIPSGIWKHLFASAPKKLLHSKEASVEVSPGEKRTAFGVATPETEDVRTVLNVDGKFPRTDEILSPSEPVVGSIRLNLRLLMNLLTVASKVAYQPEWPYIDIELRGIDKAVVFRTRNDSQQFTGVLMPVCDENDKAKAQAQADVAAKATRKRINRRIAKKK